MEWRMQEIPGTELLESSSYCEKRDYILMQWGRMGRLFVGGPGYFGWSTERGGLLVTRWLTESSAYRP